MTPRSCQPRRATDAHDPFGNLTTVTDPLGHQTIRHYDADQNLDRFTDGDSNQTTYVYDLANEQIQVQRPDTTTLTTDYNSDGTVLDLKDGKGNAILGYGYDALARVASLTDALNNVTSYSYDGAGNRLSQQDQANRLTAYGSAGSYAYNGDGLRMSKTVSGTTSQFLWDVSGSLPLLIEDGSTAYVYGPGGLPLEQVNGSTALWLHHDQLGSTRLVTNSSGSSQATYTFDAYGKLASSTNPGNITNPMRFAGEYRDAESELYYLRARYYDPTTGQFLSNDPAGPMTRAPYSYSADDPVNTIDVTGLDFLGVGQVTAGLVGAAAAGVGRAHDASVQIAEIALGAAAEWSGNTSSDLHSGDPMRTARAAVSTLLLVGMVLPGEVETSSAVRFTADQDALIQLAKSAKSCGGVTRAEAETLLDWAREYGLRPLSKGIETHPGRGFGANPHIRVGPVNHIAVLD